MGSQTPPLKAMEKGLVRAGAAQKNHLFLPVFLLNDASTLFQPVHRADLPPAVLLLRQARALLVGATVLWGLSFPLTRGLELAQRAYAPDVSDSALACADMAVRFGLAALCFLPFQWRHLGRIAFLEWSQAVGLALLAGVGLYLQTLGLAWVDASVSAFLTQMYTLLVPLIVAVRDRRFPTLRV